MKVVTPILFLSGILFFTTVNSQVRSRQSINDNWKFIRSGVAYAEMPKLDDSKWELVSLPHTWNAHDPFDDDKTYYRGIGWYRRNLVLTAAQLQKKLFLVFEGANQVADIYVNGAFAKRHTGAYTAFSVDISPYAKAGENLVAVQVNNAHDPFVAPLSIGYASYGGLYRDVWLVETNRIHFDDVNTNASGVFITTSGVSSGSPSLLVKTTVVNDGDTPATFQLNNIVYDREGKVVNTFNRFWSIQPGTNGTVNLASEPLQNVKLWSPDAPYLYTVKSQLLVDGKIVDEVTNPLGFRWFSFDANNGFSLNGKPLVLRGTNRHQDMLGKGDALTLADHERDMRIIKEMGCNFVRLAHYPQVPAVLSLADSLGLLVWEETPVLNFITEDEHYERNNQASIREMIRQGFNHPSVIMWGSTNEILLYSKAGARIATHNNTAYLRAVRMQLKRLDSTVRAEDPTRYSTMAMHGSDDYYKYGLDSIPQVTSFNIYNGWYSGKLEDFGRDLDMYHKRQPYQVLFISEYGAEGEIRLGTERPVRMDYTTQYQRIFHECYLRQFRQRPYLGGTAIWNQFDFSQPNIGGPMPHRNQKGMVTWDRKAKDVFFMYKANWNPEPMVYIATRDWLHRAGTEGEASTIDVYSNAPQVTLYINGKKQPTLRPDDVKKCSWKVNLVDGENIITASATINGKTYSDRVIVHHRLYSSNLADAAFKNISINVGSLAQYAEANGNVWINDKPYTAGSFGYTGGVMQVFSRSEVIKNTDDEPMFYSYLDSIESYRADVPDGEYKVTLCFAEPKYVAAGQRVFDVSINDNKLITDLDLAAEAGFASAFKKTFVVQAKDGKGIQLKFTAKQGSALLNGLQVEKAR